MLANLWSDDDVVDWDVDKFHKEANEAHYAKSDGGSDCDFLEFPPVGLCATLDQSDGVLGEEAAGFAEFHYLIHFKSAEK